MRFIVMGVAGCGKTTVGKALATRLGYSFIEGDEFHDEGAIDKMKSGTPLTDDDRRGWLLRLHAQLAGKDNVVLACSALKKGYRRLLEGALHVRFVYLQISREEALQRATRRTHFFPPSLVDSQFDTLEEPEDAHRIDATLETAQIIEQILETP